MSDTAVAVIPDKAPDYALALLAQYGLKPLNEAAILGISAGMPPTIGCKGTRFVMKENGEEKIINRMEISVVILAAKDAMTKRFYAGAYNPDAQAEAPDCSSLNGVTPVPDAKHKQSEACATCPQNQFGSGTDAAGNPSKGKACGDRKVLAIFAAGKEWAFEITPAALKGFGDYVRQQLNPRGLDLRTVITTIGFDEKASFPQYTFKFGGVVPQEQLVEVLTRIGSAEVAAIVNPGSSAVPAVEHRPATPETVAETPEVLVDTAAQEAVQKAAAEKDKKDKAAAAAEKKRLADEKKAAEVAATAAVNQVDDGFGAPAGAVLPAAVVLSEATAGTPSDSSLAAALGLDL